VRTVLGAASDTARPASPLAVLDAAETQGSIHDSLPFAPNGEQVASVAWRTWIYTDTGPGRQRYGYLRAGAVVDRRGPAIVNDGCAGGWYRINPRGFVCVGKGATLDVSDAVVVQTATRPMLGQGLPYAYAVAKERAPQLYFKLPSTDQMRKAEGDFAGPAAGWLATQRSRPFEGLQWQEEPPTFLLNNQELKKPYGAPTALHEGAQSGKAAVDTGFAIQRAFVWNHRPFGLTTDLDMVALDRTNVVRPSKFRGVVVEAAESLPALIVTDPAITAYRRDTNGKLHAESSLMQRDIVKLTGISKSWGGLKYHETTDHAWVPQAGVKVLPRRDNYPSVATGTRRWIDVSIRDQTLVAYEGKHPVYITLVSTGRDKFANPETSTATVRGTFMIHTKHVSTTMDAEDDRSDSFSLRDVPFVQYFHKGYALHAAYWHDKFGSPRSHGCINLSPTDSAWLFDWTDPPLPAGWHGVLNSERGTPVVIH
jgi:L,D-transpeptidase catalytic domain